MEYDIGAALAALAEVMTGMLDAETGPELGDALDHVRAAGRYVAARDRRLEEAAR